MLKNFFAIAVCIFLQVSSFSTANALTQSEARTLALGGEAEALETAFQTLHETFVSGTLPRDAYVKAFSAFQTTHPTVSETTEKWLNDYPESAQAKAARGILLVHSANLIRGRMHPGELSEPARAKIAALAASAIPLLTQGLAAEPAHLPAARSLDLLGAITQQAALRVLAQELLWAHDDPDHALLAELRLIDLSWGSTPGRPESLCGIRTKKTTITRQQCVIIALAEQSDATPELWDRRRQTLSDGPEKLFPEAHFSQRFSIEHKDAFAFATTTRDFMTGDHAMMLAYTVGYEEVLKEFIEPVLAYDPFNPTWLSALHLVQSQTNLAAAWESMEKSMELGAHYPAIRFMRIGIMEAHEDLRWDVVDELKDAFAATGGHMDFVSRQSSRLVNPRDFMTHTRDGTERDDFPCIQLLFLERHKAWCKEVGADFQTGGDYTCEHGRVIERDRIINRLRVLAQCGQSVTWKDRMRYLLDLTE